MGMTPDDFFYSFVQKNYEDFKENPGCVRLAFNAAVSATHLADHCWEYYQKHNKTKTQGLKNQGISDLGSFVKDFLPEKTGGCFDDIRHITNAYKHLYPRSVGASISSTNAVESITFKDEDDEIKKIDGGLTKDSGGNNLESKVMYTRKDGKRIEFLPTLETVINYWESFLNS